MSVQSTSAVQSTQPQIIIKIDSKRDAEKNTFTSVWQGLQNQGYSEGEILKISKELEKETINGKRFVATKIADGTEINVTNAIERAGVRKIDFGGLTTQINYNIRTLAVKEKSDNEPNANVQTFRNKPINVEPKTMGLDEVRAKYGDSKLIQTAYNLKDLNEKNGGDRTITGKSYYQPWCADMANYFYEQYNGTNPFAKPGQRNSSVAGIKRWAKNNKLFKEAKTPEAIAQQLPDIKPGDVIVFNRRYLYKTTKGDIYRNNDVRHIGVVVAAKDGKLVLIEGNTNERQIDENGNFVVDSNGIIRFKDNSDGIMFKEYDANALYCRGYSGYADMSNYQ